MSSIFFKCPVCGCKESGTIMEDEFSIGDVVECPECLNLLVVKDSYLLEDFKDILADQMNKKRAESKLKDSDSITVRYL